MTTLHHPRQNRLLAALPEIEFEHLLPDLQLVPMPLAEVLYESGAQLQYVYFPTSAIVSLQYVMENGATAEIAGVGNEGVVGISLFMGGDTIPAARSCTLPDTAIGSGRNCCWKNSIVSAGTP